MLPFAKWFRASVFSATNNGYKGRRPCWRVLDFGKQGSDHSEAAAAAAYVDAPIRPSFRPGFQTSEQCRSAQICTLWLVPAVPRGSWLTVMHEHFYEKNSFLPLGSVRTLQCHDEARNDMRPGSSSRRYQALTCHHMPTRRSRHCS